MTRDFPDELLSAFLDDELSPAERAQVERHLSASPADRQLLSELKTLRGEVAGLPALGLPEPGLSPDFADRVVRAAIAEAEKNNGARGVVSRAPPVEERHSWRRWRYGAAAASAVALAACLVLAVLVIGRSRNAAPNNGLVDSGAALTNAASDPVTAAQAVAALPEQLLAALGATMPSEREAVILRLKASKDTPVAEALEAALAAAGLKSPGGVGASAALLEEAYQKSLEGKLSDASVAAAEVVFIEAPFERLRSVVDQLAANVKDPLRLEAAGKLSLGRAWDENRAEGEAAAAPIVQRLNAGLFKLQKTVTDAAQAVTGGQTVAAIDPQQRCRVLILIEPAE